MIYVKVLIPSVMVTLGLVDNIEVTVLDDNVDRQPRSTFLEGVTRDPEILTLTFTT